MTKLLRYIPVALIASLTVATPLLAAVEPARGPDVAVVFPPGWSGADAMRAAARIASAPDHPGGKTTATSGPRAGSTAARSGVATVRLAMSATGI